MRFKDYYYHKKISLPIHFEHCYFNASGELEFRIPMKYIPMLVDEGALFLMYNGKLFKTYKEAINYYDNNPLNESMKEKYISKAYLFPDIETGKERYFEVAKGNVKIGGNITEKIKVDWHEKELDPKKLRVKVDDKEGLVKDFELAAGNAKLGNTLIMNMDTARDCMSAIIGTCKLGPEGKCYALRFEKQHSQSLEKNIRHKKQWDCLSPLSIAQGIRKISDNIGEVKYIRVNEAGDFRNLPSDKDLLDKVPEERKAQLAGIDDVEKLKAVANALKTVGLNNTVLYTYTHRFDLADKLTGFPDNLVVNGSGFLIQNNFQGLELEEFLVIYDKVKQEGLKSYGGVNYSRATFCLGDCKVCNNCKVADNKIIFLAIHGSGSKYQNKIESLKRKVIKNPEFKNILASNISDEEKLEKIFGLLNLEDRNILNKLKPIVSSQKEMFINVMNDQKAIDEFIKALAIYAYPTDYMFSSEHENIEALIKSVDALSGKFKKYMERAIKNGEKEAQRKWKELSNSLENLIEIAKNKEKLKPSADISKRFSSMYKKIKTELSKNREEQNEI